MLNPLKLHSNQSQHYLPLQRDEGTKPDEHLLPTSESQVELARATRPTFLFLTAFLVSVNVLLWAYAIVHLQAIFRDLQRDTMTDFEDTLDLPRGDILSMLRRYADRPR